MATAGSDGVLNLWSVRAAVDAADSLAADAAAGVSASGKKKKKKKRRRSKYEGVRASVAPSATLSLPEPADRLILLGNGADAVAGAGAAAMSDDGDEEDAGLGLESGSDAGYVIVALLRGGGVHVVSVSGKLSVLGDASVHGLSAPVRAAFLHGDSLTFVTGVGASPGTQVVSALGAGGEISAAVLRPKDTEGLASAGAAATGGARAGASLTGRPDAAAAAAASASGDAIPSIGRGGAMMDGGSDGEDE